MSEFNYKEYLKNNPLLTEEKISKENSDKLINYFSNLDDEDLNDTLRDLSSWGHELITKERHDNPMADRMFTDFSSVTRWILSIDDGLAKDILYAIQNDLAMPVEKGQYINEDKKPKERNGMVWADEIDKWVTKEEYIEYLETRADDHFSEPIKETNDVKAWDKLDRLLAVMDDNMFIQALMSAMSTDDAHLYLDAITRDHIDIVDDGEVDINEGFWTPQRATYPNRNRKPKTNVDGGLDSNAFAKIQAIADVYSYGEILDALESFYTKNDEIASGNLARKHAGEFRAYLDARTEIDE